MSTTLKRVHGSLAEFDSVKDLYHAADQVRDAGYEVVEASPPMIGEAVQAWVTLISLSAPQPEVAPPSRTQ